MVRLAVSTARRPAIALDFPSKHPDQLLVKDVKAAINAKFPKMVPNRQRLTVQVSEGKHTPLTDDNRSVGSYGVTEGTALRLKDLGQQVGYRMLYLWEYAGPIVLNPLFLEFSQLLWGSYQPSSLQLTYRNITVIHFLKRFLESAFVHKFSRATLPLSYVFRNCLYYWGVNGLLCGLTLYRPAYSARGLKGTYLDSPLWISAWMTIWAVSEVVNFYTHMHLRSLRTAPGQPRKYPTGFSFGTIVCANYFWETIGVISMVSMTGGDFGSLVYLSVGVFFMQLWAGQKYARYKREFDPKVFPGKRYKMFPPIY